MLRFMKFIFFCFSTSILIAGTDGTIRGQVVDVYGEPLPGVQILIEDLSQGAVTDLDGNYIILNVQVGTYDIKTSMIGYATIVTKDVNVTMDQTRWLNLTMQEEAIEGEVVEVTGERGLVEKDMTSKKVTVSQEQIEALPIKDVTELYSLQSGVVKVEGGMAGAIPDHEEKGLEEAAEYIDFVENRVEISWIKASDIESAFIVFDRMNDRGENLTVSDKFKYLLFQSTDPDKLMDKSSEINRDWEAIQNSLEQIKAKIDNFLNYFLAAKHFTDKWPSKSAMISWIRKSDNREKIGIDNPLPLLKELQDDASKFKEFWRGNDINGNPVESLNLIKSHASEVRQHIPLLMAASAGKYNKEDFEKFKIY